MLYNHEHIFLSFRYSCPVGPVDGSPTPTVRSQNFRAHVQKCRIFMTWKKTGTFRVQAVNFTGQWDRLS